jgi:hypothetical protein
MLLTGSQALAQSFPDEYPADAVWDLWVTTTDLRNRDLQRGKFTRDDFGDLCTSLQRGNRSYHMRLIPAGDVREQFIAVNRDRPELESDDGWDIRIASPSSIALIKRALLYAPSAWHKHIEQYHLLAARLDQSKTTEAERLAYVGFRSHLLARLDTESKANFNMRVKNEEFFNDFKYPWLRVHEHDDLHRTTCYSGIPLYQQLKLDQALAFVPASGFEQLSHRDRIRMVREECYALALERVLIPAQDLGVPWDENQGFQHALRRVCTTLARGWFRDFAIDNYPEVSRYDKPFLNDYQRALAQGKLSRKVLPITAEARRAWLAEYLHSQVEKDRDAAMGCVARSQLSGFSTPPVRSDT